MKWARFLFFGPWTWLMAKSHFFFFIFLLPWINGSDEFWAFDKFLGSCTWSVMDRKNEPLHHLKSLFKAFPTKTSKYCLKTIHNPDSFSNFKERRAQFPFSFFTAPLIFFFFFLVFFSLFFIFSLFLLFLTTLLILNLKMNYSIKKLIP